MSDVVVVDLDVTLGLVLGARPVLELLEPGVVLLGYLGEDAQRLGALVDELLGAELQGVLDHPVVVLVRVLDGRRVRFSASSPPVA